jgi:ceramide glucosyltransferase
MPPIANFLLTIGLAAVLVSWVAYAVTLRTAHSELPRAPARRRGISVLKPLKGLEQGLEDNLRAILGQTHPDYEVIFGAADADDPALDLARRVSADFPTRSTRVVVGSAPLGLNPKVKLLQHLETFARSELILVSDSNVRPEPNYLSALENVQAESGAALVHSILAGSMGRTLGERLEDMQLSGWVAASVCFTSLVGDPVVIGKSMLMERSALAAVGGFQAVRDILAEDYILGRRLRQAGYRVALCPEVLSVVNSGRGIGGFFNRHVRWGQMQRTIYPVAFFASLAAQPTPFLILGFVLGRGPVAWVAALALLGKWLCELGLARFVAGRLAWRTACLLPLKDVLFLGVWCAALVKRTVHWRGHRMRVGPGSRLMPLRRGDEPELREVV